MKKITSLFLFLLISMACSVNESGNEQLKENFVSSKLLQFGESKADITQKMILGGKDRNNAGGQVGELAKPKIPTDFKATQNKDTRQITLTWKASKDSVADYEVSKDNGVTWKSTNKALKYVFTGLDANKVYYLKVRARDSKNTYSNVATTSLKISNSKPSIPESFTATTDVPNTSIDLSWKASKDSDGSIVDYEVSKDNGASWVSTGKVLTYTFTGLKIGTTYDLQVRAKDNEDTYSDVASENKKLGNLKPTIPTGLATIPNRVAKTITLSWIASTDDGSIADYEVSIDNGITWTSTSNASSYTFAGLTIGTAYTLQVKAKDDENAYSPVATTRLKLENLQPTIPGSFTATTDVPNTSITLSWTASSDDMSIADYEVSKDNGASWVSTGKVLTYTFSSLSVGSRYDFQVRAKDNENTYSAVASTSKKLGNLNPTIPTALTTVPDITAKTIALSWAASNDEGFVIDYEVSKDNGVTWTSTSNALTYTFTGLTIGTTYILKVKAKDDESAYSPVATTRLKLGNLKPTVPGSFTVTTDAPNKSIALSWTASSDDGTITDYEVSKDNGANWVSTSKALTHTFSSLTIGRRYDLQVRAKDDENTYSTVAHKNEKLGNLNPTIPTNLVALAHIDNKTIELSWTASTDEDSVVDYEVSIDDGAWTSTRNTLTHTFTGLSLGLDYNLKVRAKDNENAYSSAAAITKAIFLMDISAGISHSFVRIVKNIKDKLFAAGNNTYGQLGLGHTNNKANLTELTNANIQGKVKKAHAGLKVSYIETTDRNLFVVGENDSGQLGLGNTTSTTTLTKLTNTDIQGKVAKVTISKEDAASPTHAFIETTDGKLFVFGDNSFGQLGLGNYTTKKSPVELTVVTANVTTEKPLARGNIEKVTLGVLNSFVFTKDGRVFGFGNNQEGILGIGTSTNTESTPKELTVAAGNLKDVHAGFKSTIFETKDGKLFGAGLNSYGELGLGHVKTQTTPTEITVTTATATKPFQRGNIKKVTLGTWSSFVLTKDGRLFAFGNNPYKQLGFDADTFSSHCNGDSCHTPVELTVASVADVTATKPFVRGDIHKVTSSSFYTFVETKSNKLFGFGSNSNNQLGLGDMKRLLLPTEITLPSF